MNSQHLDMIAILDRFIERAAQNLTIEKLLLQLHLDPSNITFDAIVHRLVEIVLVNINFPNMCALIAAGFYAATFLMRTMVPLRVFGILSALFFMAYGALGGAITTFLMYLCLLPINSVRLYQIVKLVKKARVAVQGDLAIDWLKPFMDKRTYRKGDILFRKGQVAKEMFLTTTGKYLVTEIGVELPPGRLVGELGFLTPNNRRTATVECLEDGAVLTISYDRLLEVYFGYPDFGYFFLRLASDRLLQNNARLEATIEQYKAKLKAAGLDTGVGVPAPDEALAGGQSRRVRTTRTQRPRRQCRRRRPAPVNPATMLRSWRCKSLRRMRSRRRRIRTRRRPTTAAPTLRNWSSVSLCGRGRRELFRYRSSILPPSAAFKLNCCAVSRRSMAFRFPRTGARRSSPAWPDR